MTYLHSVESLHREGEQNRYENMKYPIQRLSDFGQDFQLKLDILQKAAASCKYL